MKLKQPFIMANLGFLLYFTEKNRAVFNPEIPGLSRVQSRNWKWAGTSSHSEDHIQNGCHHVQAEEVFNTSISPQYADGSLDVIVHGASLVNSTYADRTSMQN